LAVANGVARLKADPAAAKDAAQALNAFGIDLYGQLRSQAGNLVVSPASIALALAMARTGARGTTATEMDTVLHNLASDANASSIASLDASLVDRTGTFQDQSGTPQKVNLAIANASFAQRGFPFGAEFLKALAERFGAGVQLVDYMATPESARAAINGWVADHTEQRIKDLLAQGTVDAATRLVLVNAIYLKAAWLKPFEKDGTQPAPFHLANGSTVEVPMMRTGGMLDYAKGSGWQAVALPYVGQQLSMLVIVPDNLVTFEQNLDGSTLAAISSGLSSHEVALSLPKFSTETKTELGDVLKKLGMPSAFSPDSADFSGMTTADKLFISAVVHQANIDVDESGTTASAATAVGIMAAAAPADMVTLTVDRPFLFALRDNVTGAVLFLGRIADPSAKAS
ncbi:MAG TPA: serpin family protein, partial [Candidatus Limnocylindrales bacterium]